MGVGQGLALRVLALLLLFYGVAYDNKLVQIPFWTWVIVDGFTRVFVASNHPSAGVTQPRPAGRGPWLLLLALLTAAVFVGALVWYYSPNHHGSGSP